MNDQNNKYQQVAKQMNLEKEQKEIQHTVYLSRRAIWANILLSMFISFLASYIHTRRWKQMGIFSFTAFILMMFVSAGSESFEESFRRGQVLSPIASLIATVENSLAIKKARRKIQSNDL
ncbi:hypothetical protein WEU38_00995 [Cyanobacterium aponinum AL20118]|uniref:Uncharacterized protein n=1 Tax=Cyanobacterium aponinum AL20115 TaxID=3090662 RepID=A0AAF0ZBG3_9CHRO|nr:hypothetical protein [Cyanobacterium aponinum]PHV63134.1 hypothetical protein CSQ80_07195 [Cyanobacterium aponinum IPPAS B-1201]WPF88878.1 hypothetical protein SAY89_01000 [Cyanobacterium aponinum AL20115]